MGRVIISEENLTNIADAIRAKNGETTTYKPGEMAAAIEAISGGLGNEDVNVTLTITNSGGGAIVTYLHLNNNRTNVFSTTFFVAASTFNETLKVLKGSVLHVTTMTNSTGIITTSSVSSSIEEVQYDSSNNLGRAYIINDSGTINITASTGSHAGSND